MKPAFRFLCYSLLMGARVWESWGAPPDDLLFQAQETIRRAGFSARQVEGLADSRLWAAPSHIRVLLNDLLRGKKLDVPQRVVLTAYLTQLTLSGCPVTLMDVLLRDKSKRLRVSDPYEGFRHHAYHGTPAEQKTARETLARTEVAWLWEIKATLQELAAYLDKAPLLPHLKSLWRGLYMLEMGLREMLHPFMMDDVLRAPLHPLLAEKIFSFFEFLDTGFRELIPPSLIREGRRALLMPAKKIAQEAHRGVAHREYERMRELLYPEDL